MASPQEPDAGIRTLFADRGAVLRFLLILVQLGLLAIVIRQFQIQSKAFLRLTILAFAGFGVHCLLPAAYRLPFFVLLSLAGIVMVMGAALGGTLIGMGLLLIWACHLPLPFRARVAVLLLVGGALAALRVGVVDLPWLTGVWPVLGAMFMFRIIVYLYDLSHDKAPAGFWRTLAYFFLLPNVCFPLFPVVDFKTFRRTYYDKEALRIYQVGVNWMALGVVQLIGYRIIYQRLALAPSEVVDPGDLVQYLVFNFLLYLRVSGHFHLVVGMLHLFGFNLPRTNNNYCLAAGFTDFWRRINIYWKDFMMKVFYYPAYFKVKRLGETRAVVLATVYVFVVTWILHSYQWLWLRGSFPVVWQDLVFWSVLALLVIATSLRELKHGRVRSLSKPTPTLRKSAKTALKTLGTFASIVVLWSLWTATSWDEWRLLWTPLGGFLSVQWVGALLALVAVSTAIAWIASRSRPSTPHPLRASIATSAVLLALAFVSIPAGYSRLGPEGASLVVAIRSNTLSRRDREQLERGYYEDLMQVNRINSQLWEVYMNKPMQWLDVQGTDLIRFTDGFEQKELAPSLVSKDNFSTVRTNKWGMRDREYDKQPGEGTLRMALLGASCAMGWGVEDDETYEQVLEDKLNRELAGESHAKFEILNLGVPGYYPLQQVVAVEKALSFHAAVVFYEATGQEHARTAYYLAEVNHKGIDIPWAGLRAIAKEAGLEPGMSESEGQKRLRPHQDKLVDWLYGHLVERVRAAGAVPVWLFVPQIYGGEWEKTIDPAKAIAEKRGFVIIDLRDTFVGADSKKLQIAEWDAHPNAEGHRMIAEQFYKQVRTKENELRLRR